jgi:RNA polymerase sigma-70 factor (ECF subfamily)
MRTEEEFRALYDAHFEGILGFALRRAATPEDAADTVSDTFLVAWRRLDEVPAEGARLWLFGIARHQLANRRRSSIRRDRLGSRLRQDLAAAVPDHADRVATSTDVLRALRAVSAADREVLELSLWEGMEPREIAAVLDIAEGAARTRLSRARTRMRAQLRGDPHAVGHLTATTATEGTLS